MIDRSLIASIDGQDKNAQLIGLGKRLNFSMLAEGVETVQDAETLRRLNCAQVQSFFYPTQCLQETSWR